MRIVRPKRFGSGTSAETQYLPLTTIVHAAPALLIACQSAAGEEPERLRSLRSGDRVNLRMIKLVLSVIAVMVLAVPAWAGPQSFPVPALASIAGTIKDALGRAVPDAQIELRAAEGRIVARTMSDARGHFAFPGLFASTYRIVVNKTHFVPSVVVVAVDGHSRYLEISVEAQQPLTLSLAVKHLNRELNDLSPETGGSVYRFTARTIGELPEGENTSLRNVLTQAPGVTQDVSEGSGFHVRGVDGQIQYRINGVMLPDLNRAVAPVFNPRFAQSIALLDGTLPAQFGYRTAGVIDIHTKSGCIHPGGELSMYGGQRATFQPSFELGGCKNDWDYYLTGQFTQNDLGIQPPTRGPQAKHDFTRQGQGFAYLSRLLSPATRVTVMTGVAAGDFQIPTHSDLTPQFKLEGVANYPPSAIDESQLEQTYYGIIALQGSLNSATDYQLAAFSRYFQSNFDPDPIGNLIYGGVASQVLNSSFANGAQGDLTYRLTAAHTLRSGFYFNEEAVESDDNSAVFKVTQKNDCTTQSTHPCTPISIVDNSNKLTLLGGVYVQDEWRPAENLVVNLGLRWDISQAFVSDNDFGPRIGLVYHLGPNTVFHAGYAHYFTPPPLEQITHKTIDKFNGTTNSVPNGGDENVKPQRGDYFDAGIIEQVTPNIRIGLDTYFDLIHQWLDQAQLGNSLVFSPINFRNGRAWGAELSSSYNSGNLVAWLNFTYAVAQVNHVSSMQFLIDPDELAYINDHFVPIDQTQQFTIAAGAAYRWRGWLLSIDSTWNSGFPFAFANQQTLPSYAQVNIGIARNLIIPHIGTVKCQAAVVNIFDRVYLIRSGNGLDVNAASYGPRRAAYLGLTIPLPF